MLDDMSANPRLSCWLSWMAQCSLLLWLSGCAAPAAIPVVERRQPPSERIMTHWVSSGETLYAIAWRYNMNVIDLARANGITQPYTIWHGQKLNLDLSRTVRRGSTAQPIITAQPSKSRSVSTAALSDWYWPLRGTRLKEFSWRRGAGGESGHKGIDIAGKRGQTVHAAQNGVVVYAGSGLPAYGRLLIVKHNDVYLSAYAHNSRLVVAEGDTVRAGQKIAEVGSSGTNLNHLHFEIRKKGKPVNPGSYLPRI
jgi:lipoprotein NlpD